jgi:hypothetical protein
MRYMNRHYIPGGSWEIHWQSITTESDSKNTMTMHSYGTLERYITNEGA